jgi:hypothetical protein
MKFQNLQRAAVLAFATAGFATAQNDECATAIVLPVNVATAFDTTSATLSTEPWPCAASTAPDIWYRYVPVANATATVETCGSGYDTALQVLSGSCAALVSIACNDDFCALQSTITFPANAGTTYYIRLGGFATLSGTGTILLTEAGPPPPGTVTVVDNLPATWIDISATGTALNLADDASAAITTTIGNTLFAAGTAQVGSNGAVRFAGPGTGLAFTNAAIPAAGCFGLTSQSIVAFWDDINTVGGTVGNIYWQETQGRLVIQWQAAGFFGSPATETVTFQIQVPGPGPIYAQMLYQDVAGARAATGGSATIGYQSGGVQNDYQWSFNTAGAVVNGDVLSIVPAGPVGVGTNYCTANVNSTGVTGLISGSGSASVAANNLTLEASRLPLNAFGYFITSTTQAVTPNPGGSQGILCIGGQIGRYTGPGQIQNSGATGSFSLLTNLTQIPTPTGFVSAVVGQVRSYQSWHRDSVGGNATSNFTNGLAVTFTN